MFLQQGDVDAHLGAADLGTALAADLARRDGARRALGRLEGATALDLNVVCGSSTAGLLHEGSEVLVPWVPFGVLGVGGGGGFGGRGGGGGGR